MLDPSRTPDYSNRPVRYAKSLRPGLFTRFSVRIGNMFGSEHTGAACSLTDWAGLFDNHVRPMRVNRVRRVCRESTPAGGWKVLSDQPLTPINTCSIFAGSLLRGRPPLPACVGLARERARNGARRRSSDSQQDGGVVKLAGDHILEWFMLIGVIFLRIMFEMRSFRGCKHSQVYGFFTSGKV